MTIDIYHCWACQKTLSDDLPFDLYFWCNKTCYEKDDLYHGRKKMLSEIKEAEEAAEKALNKSNDKVVSSASSKKTANKKPKKRK